MPIYQRGSNWLVSVGSGADRFRATLSTRQEAEQVEANELMRRKRKAMDKILGEERSAPVKEYSGITMRKLYDIACKTKWQDARASSCLIRNAGACLDILGWNTKVEDINQESIRNMAQSFVVSNNNSGSTVNRKLSSLSVMLRIAEDEGWIQRAPRMPRRKEASHRIRYMTNEEEQKAIAYAEHMGFKGLADFIPFAIDTGFRRGEILRLHEDDCRDNLATLHAGTTKSEKARSVPLTRRVQEIVNSRRGMGRIFHELSESSLRLQWTLLREHMKLEDDPHFVVHMLRHTCASRLAMAGKNAVFIKDWMGHSSIMVTQRYMHLAPATMLEGVDALDNYRKPKLVAIGGR